MAKKSGNGAQPQSEDESLTAEAHPRAVGSPLPMGAGQRPAKVGGKRLAAPAALGRTTLAVSTVPQPEEPSNVQKAVNAMRAALPFVQRLLPLLDGNIVTAVTNLLAPHPHSHANQPQVQVDLAPVEEGLTQLQTQHRELSDKFAEQNSTLKRVEDQLEMVREATDRNTLEQQELLEDLKSVGQKINMVAFVALGLLVVSIILNVILYLHIQRVLP